MYLTVRAWEHQSLLAIIEPDEKGRLTVWTPHLHHVAHAVGPVDGAAVHA
jgi:hypothetical protein